MKAHKRERLYCLFQLMGLLVWAESKRYEDGIESTGELLLTLHREQLIEGDEEETVDFSVSFTAV